MSKAYHLSGYAQGTTYHITYYASDSLIGKARIDQKLAQIDSALSLYKPYSQINQFNASTAGVSINTFFQAVVKKSVTIYRATGGAFDITVQPLVEAWGFGPAKPTTLPDTSTIRALLPCIGTDKIHLNKDFLGKALPCTRIDVNGIAQGYSVDVLAGLLEEKSIRNYLVELGGEIRVKGRKPNGEPMTIGIEAPESDEFLAAPIQKMIRLEQGALTTSGSYRKFYQNGSQKISHLIDPHTGYPMQQDLISVTVLARDAITADGYDNALMVMGLKGALTFLKGHPELQAYFIYQTPDGTIKDTATQGFYRLVVNDTNKKEKDPNNISHDE